MIQAAPSPLRVDRRKTVRSSRGRPGFQKLRSGERTLESKRLAAAILEVLAGARTPTEVAQVLGISVPRYYALEERALEGLLAACQRRPKGRGKTPERELLKLKKEIGRLERENARSQALLRAARRAVGLPAPERAKPRQAGKKRPRRSRVARALRAAEALRSVSAGISLDQGGEKGDDKSRGEK